MSGGQGKLFSRAVAVAGFPLLALNMAMANTDSLKSAGAFEWSSSKDYVGTPTEVGGHQPQWQEMSQRQIVQLPDVSISAPELSERLGIVEAVQKTISWHPDLAESLGQLGQQGEQVDVAEAGYYPQVSAGISSQYRSTTSQSEDAFSVNASQMLYDFGKVAGSVDVAEYGVDRERASVLLTVDTLARDTAQAAIETQRYHTLIMLAEQQVEAVQELLELAEKRSALGASTRSDELQARSRLDAAYSTKLSLETELKVWQTKLQSLIGASRPISASDQFPDALQKSCSTATATNWDSVPEMMVAEARRSEAIASLERERAEFFPTLSLDTGFNQYLNKNMAGDNSEFTAGVNLTSNLFQGGATRARNRAADYALQSAESAKDAAYLNVTQAVNEAKSQSDNLRLQISILNERTKNIIETQRLYRDQYLSLGTRTLLDLLNAEQEIFQSEVEKGNAKYDLRSLQVQCLYSTGKLRSAFELGDHAFQGVDIKDE